MDSSSGPESWKKGNLSNWTAINHSRTTVCFYAIDPYDHWHRYTSSVSCCRLIILPLNVRESAPSSGRKAVNGQILKLIVNPCSYLCRYNGPTRKRWRAKSGKSSGGAQPWLNGRKKLSWISGALACQTDGDSIGRSLLPSFALTCLFSNSYFPSPLYLSASLLSFMHFGPPSHLLHFSSFFSRAACHPPATSSLAEVRVYSQCV